MAKRIRKPAKKQPTPPKHRSFSQISQYLNCAKQYEFNYILRIPREGINLNFVFGKFGHKFIETVLNARLVGNDFTPKQIEECRMSTSIDMGKKIKTEIAKFNQKHPLQMVKAPIDEMRRQLELLLKQWCVDVLPEVNPIAIEQKIEIELAGETFLMYLDLVQELGNGENAILDWKFVKATKGDRAVKDSLQLSLYALASGINNVGFCSLVKPREGKESKWKPNVVIKRGYRSQSDIEFAKKIMEDAVRGINIGYFPRCSPENFLCTEAFCDFWLLCRGKDQVQSPDWMG